MYRIETLRTCLGDGFRDCKVSVAVGGGYRANMKTGIESFSHKITNCQRYNNIIRDREEESLFALQPLGALGGRGVICE